MTAEYSKAIYEDSKCQYVECRNKAIINTNISQGFNFIISFFDPFTFYVFTKFLKCIRIFIQFTETHYPMNSLFVLYLISTFTPTTVYEDQNLMSHTKALSKHIF